MKIRLFFTLAVIATLFSTPLKADAVERFYTLEGTNIRFSAQEHSKAITITLNNVVANDITITLEDAVGNSLVNEKVSATPNFAKRYNLTNLENGNYRFIIKKKLSKTIQPFELTAKTVVMSDLKRKEKFLPNIAQRDNKLDVNVLLGNYSNIHVRIYDLDGRNVFEETNYVVFMLHKRYDLSKMPKGVYTVEVVAGDETEYYNINL